jgi:phage-related holin
VIQENKLILGFKSFGDLIDAILGLKNPLLNFIMAISTTMTTFITSYIWNDASAVYFMLSLIIIDALSGIWKSVKYKTFRSSRLPRICVISLIYVVMLAISWNAANYSSLFIWLPGMVYGGLIGTQIVSIYENFSELGYLPKGLLYDIKEKIQSYFNSKYKKD